MNWAEWIGRETTQYDRMDTAFARRWLATFDQDWPADNLMPQGIHLCLCTPETASANIGEDGHPRRDMAGSFMPPLPLPRRMWASSRMRFHQPIEIGDEIARTSRIASISEKNGNSGALAFVDVAHQTFANGMLAVEEVQTLVYRDKVSQDAPLSPPEIGTDMFDHSAWDRVATITPRAALLFRYSALTFNSHRIHYDAPYAINEERYRGLVVHGPLIATLLLNIACQEFGANSLARFDFRASSPALCDEVLHLAMRQNGDEIELGSFAVDGRQTLSASAALA